MWVLHNATIVAATRANLAIGSEEHAEPSQEQSDDISPSQVITDRRYADSSDWLAESSL